MDENNTPVTPIVDPVVETPVVETPAVETPVPAETSATEATPQA